MKDWIIARNQKDTGSQGVRLKHKTRRVSKLNDKGNVIYVPYIETVHRALLSKYGIEDTL